MDYYRWYQEKYQEGYIGYRGLDGVVKPFYIDNVDCRGQHSSPCDVYIHDSISGINVPVTDPDIVWELPQLDRYVQLGDRCSFVRYRTNRTYRYAFSRSNLEMTGSIGNVGDVVKAIYNTEYPELSTLEASFRGTYAISTCCALDGRGNFMFSGRTVGTWRFVNSVFEVMINPQHINCYPLLNQHYKIKGVGYAFED